MAPRPREVDRKAEEHTPDPTPVDRLHPLDHRKGLRLVEVRAVGKVVVPVDVVRPLVAEEPQEEAAEVEGMAAQVAVAGPPAEAEAVAMVVVSHLAAAVGRIPRHREHPHQPLAHPEALLQVEEVVGEATEAEEEMTTGFLRQRPATACIVRRGRKLKRSPFYQCQPYQVLEHGSSTCGMRSPVLRATRTAHLLGEPLLKDLRRLG